MAWIESHDEIWDHWKIERMVDMLGGHFPDLHREELRAMIVGQLQSLWHFILRNAWRDADMTRWGEPGIERAARWTREPGQFIAAMRQAELLDGMVVHGWVERAGRLIYDRIRNENRRKSTGRLMASKPVIGQTAVKRRTSGGKAADKRRTNGGQSKATVPYRTVPTTRQRVLTQDQLYNNRDTSSI